MTKLSEALQQIRALPPMAAGQPAAPASPQGGEEGDGVASVDEQRAALSESAMGAGQPADKSMTRIGNAGDITSGAVRGAGQAVNETVDLAAQVGKAGGDALWSLKPVRNFLDPRKDDFGGWLSRRFIDVNNITRGTGFINQGGDVADIPVPAQSDSALGRVSEGISQTIVGFVAGGRVLRGLGVAPASGIGGKIIQGAAAGAIGDFAAFDGNEERLSNLIESVPQLRNPITDYLAADKDTPELEGRLKNTLEGLGVGAAFEGVMGVLRGTKALRKGDKAGVDAATAEIEAIVGKGNAPKINKDGSVSSPLHDEMMADQGKAAAAKAKPDPKAPKPEEPKPPEVPDTVMSRQDVDNLSEEIKFNRNFSDDLNIKPDSEKALTRKHGEWTLNTYGTPENLDATLRAVVERTSEKVVRTDAELMATVKASADELGQTPEMMMAAGSHIAGIAGDIDTAVLTMRTLWARTARGVDDFVGKDVRAMSDEEFANVTKAIHNAMTFGNYMGQVKSAMGRGLRVFQLPDADAYNKMLAKGDPEGLLAKPDRGMAPLPATREDANDWLELWGFTKGDPKARTKMLEGLNVVPEKWHYLRNSFANVFTANILSGVPSIVLNVAGPALIGTLRSIEKTSGGYVAALFAKNPAERAALIASSQNAAKAYVSAVSDVGQSFKFAIQAGQQGRSILGGGGSVSDSTQQFGPLTENLLRAADKEPRWQYTLGNMVNLWPRAFSRLNNGLDEFSKRLGYLGEIRVRALTEGSQQGLKGDALKSFVEKKLASSTDEVGAATDEAMLESAERTTLTGSPGTEGSFARKGANFVNDLRKSIPEVRYVLPIFNVPANAIGETLRRVPALNFMFKDNWQDLMGHNGPVAKAEAYGRTLLGGGFLMSGFYMARAGLLTGPGPDNPADRKVWLQTHQPYSVRIGDQWVNYSRYDIAGALLGIPATVFDASVHRRQDRGFEHVTYAAVGALAQYFRDRAALQTASDLMNLGEPGTNPENFFQRLEGSVGGRLLVPNFITQLGRNVSDPAVRTKNTAFEHVMDMLPLTSQGLDPLRNVLGEPIFKPQDQLLENVLPITISSANDYDADQVIDEIDRLYQATGYGAGVTMQDDISGGFFDARKVQLEDGRSMFDAAIRQRMTVDVDGLNLRGALKELFASSEYEDAVDADASNQETSDGLISRGYLTAQVFRRYNSAAKAKVAEESPVAARHLAVVKAKRTDDARLAGYQAEDLATDGGKLLDALGIDIQAYEDTVKEF